MAASIKLWLDPAEYAAVAARLECERLADLALSERLAAEWDALELSEVRAAA